MKVFLQRSLTGILFVALLLGAIIGGEYSFFALFFLIILLGQLEFYRLFEINNTRPQKYFGVFIGASFFVSCFLAAKKVIPVEYLFVVIVTLVFISFIYELFTSSQKPFSNIAYTLLGVVYIALPFSATNFLVFQSGTYNYHLLLGCFILLWTNDTAAYILGKSMGKHKLFERISPNKTWEGTVGGAIICIISALIISNFYNELNQSSWLILAVIVIVFGTLGDLVESLLKRSIDIKDSGSLLPGHGGILDRFDSFLFAIIFVLIYLYIF